MKKTAFFVILLSVTTLIVGLCPRNPSFLSRVHRNWNIDAIDGRLLWDSCPNRFDSYHYWRFEA